MGVVSKNDFVSRHGKANCKWPQDANQAVAPANVASNPKNDVRHAVNSSKD